MVATARKQETSTERMVRLAEKARSEGVELLYSAKTGRYLATSGTQQDTRYEVSPHLCTCRGHERYGVCKHRSALLAALGFIPRPGATPVIPAPVTCRTCKGEGSQSSTELYRGRRVSIRVQCPHCHGNGTTQDAERMVA